MDDGTVSSKVLRPRYMAVQRCLNVQVACGTYNVFRRTMAARLNYYEVARHLEDTIRKNQLDPGVASVSRL